MAVKPEHTSDTLIWIARQCVGLAQAVKALHQPISLEAQISPSDNASPNTAWVGRHGDIKPENILYFYGAESAVLQLSDFGLTRFHRPVSEHRMYDNLAGSRTYRSPECDMREPISRSFDIWALGCVYLEFLVWYTMGYEDGVEAFAKERIDDDRDSSMAGGGFFAMSRRETCAEVKVHLKHSVVKVFGTLENGY